MSHPLLPSIIDAIRTIKDPEIPVNIHDLGLIYDVQVSAAGEVTIDMTLTSPNCPVAEALPASVRTRVAALPGVTGAVVNLVFDPPWTPERMSDDAKLALDYVPGGPRGIDSLKRGGVTPLTIGRRPGGQPPRG